MSSCILDTVYQDSFSVLIDHILKDQAHNLPDLGKVQVLLPELDQLRQFRTLLLDRAGLSAVIPPQINTLRGWVEEQTPPKGKILNTHARELMLVETLRELEPFGKQQNPWTLADNLLNLFDELQLSHHQASGLSELFDHNSLASDALSHFSEEAQKIQLLWQDFQRQQTDEKSIDRVSLYLQGLEHLTTNAEQLTAPIYFAGFNWLHSKELQLIETLLKQQKLTVIVRSEQPLAAQLQEQNIICKQLETEHSTLTISLDTIFNTQTAALKDRAEELAIQLPDSMLERHLQIFPAASDEQEAHAVELQTRLWLLEGKQKIAIVTEDRRLARRISALLNNAGLSIQDSAGWPLSTTTAAGIFERWLQSIENDFYYAHVLDVLKSGFLKQQSFKPEAVFHLEKDIIERENIARNLDAYEAAITDRNQRLNFDDVEYAKAMAEIISHLRKASTALIQFLDTGAHPPGKMLEALTQSIKILGLYEGFELDPAGLRILQELKDLEQSLHGRNLLMTWTEFHGWLQRALETHNFRPGKDDGQVELINFNQSNSGQYDALIIAGASFKHLPGRLSSSGFFNDTVRQELGLKHWSIHRQERFSQFRRLLHAADKILITYTKSQNGEAQLPSPWVDLLISFHQTAYGNNLNAADLRALLNHPDSQLRNPDQAVLPSITKQPAPKLPKALVPKRISASAHQMLILCPYRFFAARGLNLKPREAIAEQLGKRDYGNLVHQCLQAFHYQQKRVSTISRNDAIALLTKISKKRFNEILETDYSHRSWWQTWAALIPVYIDWQIRREEDWQVKETEQKAAKQLDKSRVVLEGRIDRVDENPEGLSLIDYKTGGAHKKSELESGEDVQLLSYALMVEQTHELLYLHIDRSKGVKAEGKIEAEELATLIPQLEQRLDSILYAIQHGEPMPAWGDEKTCQYCEFSGLCRRENW